MLTPHICSTRADVRKYLAAEVCLMVALSRTNISQEYRRWLILA
jgi:hypothetical protein